MVYKLPTVLKVIIAGIFIFVVATMILPTIASANYVYVDVVGNGTVKTYTDGALVDTATQTHSPAFQYTSSPEHEFIPIADSGYVLEDIFCNVINSPCVVEPVSVFHFSTPYYVFDRYIYKFVPMSSPTVYIQKMAGNGTATIKRYGVDAGYLISSESSKIIPFTQGETYIVNITPAQDYAIDKICRDLECTNYGVNPNITGTIGTTDENFYVYFKSNVILTVNTVDAVDLGSNSFGVTITSTGAGSYYLDYDGTSAYTIQMSQDGSIYRLFTGIPAGTHTVCAYEPSNYVNRICDSVVVHAATPTPTPTPSVTPTPAVTVIPDIPPADRGFLITVQSNPSGARVIWSGNDMGYTNTSFYTYGMNGYTIQLTKNGYVPYSVSGTFTGNDTIFVNLTPDGTPEQRGTHLIIDSLPHGANVFRNGDLIGVTPTELYLYGMNDTTLVFKLQGYQDKTIHGIYNQTTFINAILTQSAGSTPIATPRTTPIGNPGTQPADPNNLFVNGANGIWSLFSAFTNGLGDGTRLIISAIIICIAYWKGTDKRGNGGGILAAIAFIVLGAIGFIPTIWVILGLFVIAGLIYISRGNPHEQ